ncbi:MAG: Prolyl endopeptidase, partial [uncultured Gemmatimonadaceae bacterium]
APPHPRHPRRALAHRRRPGRRAAAPGRGEPRRREVPRLPSRRAGGRLPRDARGRPLPLAGGGRRARDGGVGGGAERGDRALPGGAAGARAAQGAPHEALGLPQVHRAAPLRPQVLLLREPGAQEPERPLRAGPAGRARPRRARPEHAVARRHGGAHRARRDRRRAAGRVRHRAERVRLAGAPRARRRARARPRRHGPLGEVLGRVVDRRRQGVLLLALRRAQGGRGAHGREPQPEAVLPPRGARAGQGRADLRAPRRAGVGVRRARHRRRPLRGDQRLAGHRRAEPGLRDRPREPAQAARDRAGGEGVRPVRRGVRLRGQHGPDVLLPHDQRGAARPHHRGEHQRPARERLAHDRPRGGGRARGRADRGARAGRHLPRRRQERAPPLRARRQAARRGDAAGRRDGHRGERPARRRGVLLHVHVVPVAGHGVPLRPRARDERGVPPPDARLRRGPLRDQAAVRDEQGRHARADLRHGTQGRDAGRHQPHAAVLVRRVQHPDDAGLLARHARVAGDGRRVRGGEPARGRRVRPRVARGRDVREEAERLRRLHRGRRAPRAAEVHVAGQAGDPGRLERRAARGGGDDAAPRPVRRRAPGRGGDGHAALPQVHDRLGVGRRVRLGRQAGAVQVPPGVLAAAQPEAGDALPRHARDDRGPRRPGGARPLVQVRRRAAGRAGQGRPARAHPHRHEGRPRRGQAHREAHRGGGGRVRVHAAQPRRDGGGAGAL